MKRIIIYILLLILFSIQLLKAQINLVPNYSFEIYDTCPDNVAGIGHFCSYWYTPTSKMIVIPPPPHSLSTYGSSDYFNKCAITITSDVPKNYVGFQNANLGDAYAGILLIYNTVDYSIINYMEYIEVELDSILKKKIKYYVEFYYSIAEFGEIQDYYSLEIGALLTDTVVYRLSGIGTTQPQNIYTIPQIKQQLPLMKDTNNWIRVSGSFIANGGEKYLTIGNFQTPDSLINKNVYVYIDNVRLWSEVEEPINIDSLTIPNIFTPNEDGINDKFEYKNQEQWNFETQIFNRWGNLVYEDNNSKNWDGFYKGNKVSAGVYFYIIKAQAIKNGEVKVYKGTVTVVY